MTLYDAPPLVKMFEIKAPYPSIHPAEVYFFLSKDAFPPDLQWAPLGTMETPENSQWSDEKLVGEFQKTAAEIGANAVVFDSVETRLMTLGFLYYTGHATAYRLFKQSSLELADLSSTQYGTQTPNLQLVPHPPR